MLLKALLKIEDKLLLQLHTALTTPFLTFEKFKVIPIQNITNPRKTGIKFLNTDKEFGRIKLKVKKK